MTRELILTEPADEDINPYIARLNERNPDAARRFLRALDHAFDRILAMPQIGHIGETKRPDLAGLRVWRIDDFLLSISFCPRPTAIEVMRILHHSQDIKVTLEDL